MQFQMVTEQCAHSLFSAFTVLWLSKKWYALLTKKWMMEASSYNVLVYNVLVYNVLVDNANINLI